METRKKRITKLAIKTNLIVMAFFAKIMTYVPSESTNH